MTAPFRASPLPVKPEWIDFNGHLNMAYYSVLMDTAVDQVYEPLGFGEKYRAATGCTTYIAEFHICYLRELHEGDMTVASFQLLDFDEKRFHSFVELRHEDGWLAATGEGLTLHIDQSGPKAAPMPDDIQARLQTMKDNHASLPWPKRAGRKIGINR